MITRAIRSLPLALFGLASFLPAAAQTTTPPPAWSSARSVGRATHRALIDAAGNSYEWGQFFGTTTIGGTTLTSAGGYDAFVAKYSPQGSLLWLRQLGSAGTDDVTDLTIDGAGNAYAIGQLTGTVDFGGATLTSSGLGGQGFLVRYSPQGTAAWAQLFSTFTVQRVRTYGSGQVFVVGNFTGTVSTGGSTLNAPANSTLHYFLAQYSDAGQLQWLKPAFGYLNAANVAYRDVQLAVAPGGALYLSTDFDGSLTVGSNTLTSRGLQDVLLMRYTAQGQPEWTHQFGSAGREQAPGMGCDAAGNVYLAGSFTTALTFGSSPLPSAGATDAFLAKVGSDGAPLWAVGGGGPSVDQFLSLSVDAAGNTYATGSFYGNPQFSPVTLSGNLNNTHAAVVAYSPQGQLRWAQQTDGAGASAGYSISQNAAGDLQVYGAVNSGPATFGAGLSVTPATTGEFWVARLGAAPLATRAAHAQPLALYPSPAHAAVQLPGLPAGTAVQLIDARGRVVRTAAVAAGAVSVRGLAPGLYQLRAADGHGQQYSGRVVVE